MHTIPTKINLGSGKDFREDYLNIDISDYWQPDIVADVSAQTFPDKKPYKTQRFGSVFLASESIDTITCNDVLEHVPDLMATMTSCLNLLGVGGVFNIAVPYDLSYGAWQDPTHIRAFNERSWLYYTDWFWYMRWQTHRFMLQKLDFTLSPLGRQMHQAKHPQEFILRTPRAIDAMTVALVKVALSEDDKKTLQKFTQKRPVA